MPDLHVLCLEGDDLALAYPLVRSSARVGPEQWMAFAGGLIAGGGGVLGARADGDCLYGLATFRPLNTLRHGRALYVELVVAVELSRRQPVRDVLLHELNRIAHDRACPSILLTIPAGTRAGACGSWQANGYVQETCLLVREVAA
jgi:hypothetical protein